MKKTAVFEFPDDFKFPKYFREENTTRTAQLVSMFLGVYEKEEQWSSCYECPFCEDYDLIDWWCALQKKDRDKIPKPGPCPFYDMKK